MTRKNLKYIIAVLALLVSLGVYYFQTQPTGLVLGQYLNTSSTELRLIFFAVGQGDSSLIITPGGQKILVDGGPDRSLISKLDGVLPLADRRIDYIILSHPHADHLTALPEVLRRYQIGEVIMNGTAHTAPDYLDFLRLIKEQNIPTKIIEQPQELVIDGIKFEFLEPTESFLATRPENLNDSSIVFKLIYASTSALYMGDFENEESLVINSTVPLKADLLKIGHHGSTNANDQNFLAAVSPTYAVIPVGKNNSYGHPHYRTLYYLKQLGAQIFRTDQEGDLVFTSDGQTMILKTN